MFSLFLLVFLPTYTYANIFNNYTNIVSFFYKGENCTVEPFHLNSTNTFNCFPYHNVEECCKHNMKQYNFTNPLNICYNKNGNSSFSTCYQQHLSQFEENTIGILSCLGLLLITMLCGAFLYSTFKCLIYRRRSYESIN